MGADPVSIDELIREVWKRCDSDDGPVWVAVVDQWWAVSLKCGHGKYRGVSNGPCDLSRAFERLMEGFRRDPAHNPAPAKPG